MLSRNASRLFPKGFRRDAIIAFRRTLTPIGQSLRQLVLLQTRYYPLLHSSNVCGATCKLERDIQV